jgi:surface antigen Omp85-like protein/WD40 repeat protein
MAGGARMAMAGIAALAILVPSASWAQYFGANKIQYKPQTFRILSTDHFDIYFHLDNREAADIAGTLAERWRERLAHFFNHELSGRQPLVMYNSHVDFEQTLIVDSLIDAGTRGFTEPWRRRIVLPFAGPLADTSHVIGHELVHAFQLDLMESSPSMLYKDEARPLPLWLTEGLAEYLTIGPVDAHTAMWLRDAAIRDDLPHIDKLDRPDRFPYRWGHALLAYIGGRWGAPALAELYRVAMFEGVATGIERALDLSVDQLSEQWHAAIREEYLPGMRSAVPVGEALIRGRRLGGSMNVGPSLSPDGRWLAFLSERSFFSIDLFVADAHTGEISRRLTDTAVDPHYSSLQFIDSAGAWARDSKRLAVSAVMSGRAVIALFDWPDGKRRREVVVRDVDEIAGLTWSPDGRAIAFAGLTDGVTDLFVYDLERSSLRRLTHDAFAELQPAWSPDGRRIAFVTDRFTTDVGALTFGEYRLALIDVNDAKIEPVAAFATAKNVNPQWSADGRSLYFVSDRDGISNLYCLDLNDGRVTRMTRSATGISGVSAFSPSVSIATDANLAAAVVFTRGTFAIHTLPVNRDPPTETLATVLAQSVPERVAAAKPIAPASPQIAASAWPIARYKPRLSLEGMSQGSIAVGVDRFGAAVGSGLGVVFSDVLNTHRLATAVQVNQNLGNGFSLADMAVYGAYANRAHRWNWGLVGSSLPTLAAVRSVDTRSNSIMVPNVSLIRQTERTGTAIASYGLNRARRVEFAMGIGRLTYDRAVFSDDRGEWTMAAKPAAFTTLSAALVSDMTSFGATSVVRGQRYRFEVAPTVGTLRHVSVLADYRKYFMPVPFYTLAVRGLHFGRYGKGAEDPRLAPLYLGYPALIRGYELDTLVTSECVVALSEGCAEIEQQLGSRLAVANVELRFPLLRPFGVSPRMYGPIPVEVALFMDAGAVWRRGLAATRPDPGSAWSTGLTLRTNLAGLGLAQFNVARPLHGPRSGWVVQFNLVPAF